MISDGVRKRRRGPGNAEWQVHESQKPPPGHPGWPILRSTEKGAALCQRQSVLAGQSLAGTDRATLSCLPRFISRMTLNLGLGQ